ncbi:hypothetical protein D3C87_1832040 [compost metagenome]
MVPHVVVAVVVEQVLEEVEADEAAEHPGEDVVAGQLLGFGQEVEERHPEKGACSEADDQGEELAKPSLAFDDEGDADHAAEAGERAINQGVGE